jgi:diguanylate cyclase (GGDEF)-like protein/PAS domain S-box-containing protein
MQHQNILPVLYDLSVTIGNEVKLKSLLTRTLQRLLYHTSYSAGFICLDLGPCGGTGDAKQVMIEAAVGDFDLIALVGQQANIPCELAYGGVDDSVTQGEILENLHTNHSRYRSFVRLPLDNGGVIILLAVSTPETELVLTRALQPVLAQLSKAIVLCRSYEEQSAASEARQAQIQKSLDQIESQFRSLVELSPIGVGLSSDGLTIDANAVYLSMFGYSDISELSGKPLIEQIAPDHREKIVERIRLRAQGKHVENNYETMGLRKDGSVFPMLVSAKRVEAHEGARTFTFFVDLTEQKRTEQAMRSANKMLRLVLETAPLRIFWKDVDLNYMGCNTVFARDAGLNGPEELLGKDDFQMGWREQAELYRGDDRMVMSSNKPKLNIEEPQTTPDGHQIWLKTSKVPLHDATGEVVGVLGIYDDITEQKLAESQIHQLAFYDQLTNLPNRRLMRDRLQQALLASARSRRYGALLVLDMDDFKLLNDAKGHTVGDLLLVEVGRRLVGCVRDGDTVARLGGDEFVVILEALSKDATDAASQAEDITKKIHTALCEPYLLQGLHAQVSSSIGIVLFIDHHEQVDELLKFADTAMYQAKAGGRNTIRFFDPKMQAEQEVRLKLAEDLRLAISRQELSLNYQRQVDSTGRVIGAEALLRWNHSEQGWISPATFIPVAEDNGSIIVIGDWVLHTACAQLKSWQHKPRTRDIVLAVNVSAKQFRQADFVSKLQQVLLVTGARPSSLKLELTESTVLENVEDAKSKMRELKLMGISFSMDDFGTGYSSLQYLKRLPLDQIKIDQSFVRDITTDPNDAAIVQTIIAMTEALGLNVIAEGVETKEQQEFLYLRGCHAFQGYYFGRPVPLKEFEESLNPGKASGT